MSSRFRDEYFSSGQVYADDETHEWRKCGGNYYVCKEGYVSRNNKVLKPKKGDKYGHQSVCLYINGERQYKYVHRLVAEAFLPNPNNHPIVRHLDDDADNNNAENLAWGTQQDNLRDMRKSGNNYILTDEDREKHLKRQRRPVIAISKNGKEIKFESQTEAARRLGLKQANVGKVLKGERIQTCGYRFKYSGVN